MCITVIDCKDQSVVMEINSKTVDINIGDVLVMPNTYMYRVVQRAFIFENASSDKKEGPIQVETRVQINAEAIVIGGKKSAIIS